MFRLSLVLFGGALALGMLLLSWASPLAERDDALAAGESTRLRGDRSPWWSALWLHDRGSQPRARTPHAQRRGETNTAWDARATLARDLGSAAPNMRDRLAATQALVTASGAASGLAAGDDMGSAAPGPGASGDSAADAREDSLQPMGAQRSELERRWQSAQPDPVLSRKVHDYLLETATALELPPHVVRATDCGDDVCKVHFSFDDIRQAASYESAAHNPSLRYELKPNTPPAGAFAATPAPSDPTGASPTPAAQGDGNASGAAQNANAASRLADALANAPPFQVTPAAPGAAPAPPSPPSNNSSNAAGAHVAGPTRFELEVMVEVTDADGIRGSQGKQGERAGP